MESKTAFHHRLLSIQLVLFIITFGAVTELESKNPSSEVATIDNKGINSTVVLDRSNFAKKSDNVSLLDILQIDNYLVRKRRNLEEVPSPICSRLPYSKPSKPPVLCYQCKSNDAKGECDTKNWNLLGKGRKQRLRLRCPAEIGAFCVKKVQEQSDTQITERGCYGEGPETTLDGNVIKLKIGCVTYHQNGFKTRSCLCDTDLCNSTKNLKFRNIMLAMTGLVALLDKTGI